MKEIKGLIVPIENYKSYSNFKKHSVCLVL